MNFGIPREAREYERRVGLTPAGVFSLIRRGHRVYIEHDAGQDAGFEDEDYRSVGAEILYSAEEVYGRSEVIAKVSRLREAELEYVKPGLTILAFLHLAVAPQGFLKTIQDNEITAIAYELIRTDDGNLPVLVPTSQVAGRLAPIIAGQLLENPGGGRGILLSGIPGVPPAAVAVLGAGVVGQSAARAFRGLGAQVTILDRDYAKLAAVDLEHRGTVTTLISNHFNINRVLKFADVLVGAVLLPGIRTPILITRDMLKQMRPRSVFIDFSIDQGGCAETSRPSTHRHPTYIEEQIIHYTVPNVPARVARTGSYALANAALPYLIKIGELGITEALHQDASLERGLQFVAGKQPQR